MAINKSCATCNKEFITSAASGRYLCEDCDGTTARKKAEADRWAKLTPDEKCNELLARVEWLEQKSQWSWNNAPIG